MFVSATSLRGCGAALPLRAARPAMRRPLRVFAQAAPDRPSGGGSRAPPGSSFEQPVYQAPSYQVEAAVAAGNAAAAAANAAAASTLAPVVVQVQPSLSTVTVTGEVATNGVLTPAQIYEKAAATGAYKASLPWWKIVLLGMVAGCYVGLGGALLLTVGPNCPGIASNNPGLAKYITGAIGFPFALLQILVCGSELFTGNTALCFAALLEGKIKWGGLIKNWVCAYAGNILGCALMVAIFANTGLLPQLTKGAEALAIYKTAAPFKETFLKAICANWFVCLAVWQALGTSSFGGKFIACLGPVSAFVCIGLEHCIANIFFVPLGIVCGAPVTLQQFFTLNLIPVTLGNIVAGTVCMATVYSLLYGALGRKITGAAKTA
ncbi:nitrite transporter NAR1 [Micractinium conductrix]|uniref:Nitrite transporter NAR1 n=1 Tax=Micractinium conductrix TaxID=554055 RepID=A0A2P6VF62_9CHLO|nr:nitrite transporter NAR1 [Micractinium conductrix]|eukprot:PSC72709.1 nitrite transporter NAR1 [Micractinium conductrix]